MAEDGISLENAQNVDTQIGHEYEVRYANGAIQELSGQSVGEIRAAVKALEGQFSDRRNILSSLQSAALFARTTRDPEALLTAIDQNSEGFVKDVPGDQHDGTWHDVRKAREITAGNSGVGNIAYLMWEKTAARYKEVNGEYPQTPEEKQKFQEAKTRAKTTTVS